jgi:hypothetical protein
MQSPDGDPVLDRVSTEAQAQELRARQHAVLAPGQLPGPRGRRLMTFAGYGRKSHQLRAIRPRSGFHRQ